MTVKDMLRILVVDDETPARKDLKRILGTIAGVEIAGEASEGLEAVKSIRKLRPDVVLLDIQMPGLDGFQVVSRIVDMERMPAIIFVTAYDQYAIKAFDVHAADYILKPVEEKRLAQAIARARRIRTGTESGPDLNALLGAIGAAPKRLAVRHGESLVMVDVNDILYATVADGSIKVVAREVEGSVAFRSLDELGKELGQGSFARVHKSYLANVNRIYEITPWFGGSYKLRMEGKGGPVIPLSRAQAKELRKILKW